MKENIAKYYKELTVEEMEQVVNKIRYHVKVPVDNEESFFKLRFLAISLKEPAKADIIKIKQSHGSISIPRQAEVVTLNPRTGKGSEFLVNLATMDIVMTKELPWGVQPMLSFCEMAYVEDWIKSNEVVTAALKQRYGIVDMSKIAVDAWNIAMSCNDDITLMNWRSNPKYNTDPLLPTNVPGRLVQCLMYQRQYGKGMEDNHYAHPIDIVPIVDLNAMVLLKIEGIERPAPKIPTASVQYHRDVLYTNTYLQTTWRDDTLTQLNITQPDGPSFSVSTDNVVEWQKWKFIVGFNYREGIVLYDISFDGRPVLDRASLVEMSIPYADTSVSGRRKCAFDTGDYGIGFCSDSLELGCDCLGHIHYFDVLLHDGYGNPIPKKKVICLHEEDQGILWKHVEFRNGHNESRRARELVVSSIATVANYEYAFYWRFKQDGTMDCDIKLTGMLSTSMMSAEEELTNSPNHGVIVAPGVNAQYHQHMFCARLDMAVDGVDNIVSEVDVLPIPLDPIQNPWGNAFEPVETILDTEKNAIRTADPMKARVWKISSATKKNPINGKPTAYKLIPFTRGPAQPPMLTDDACIVTKRAMYAKANLWVTPHMDNERFPAGEYTTQTTGMGGLPIWTDQDRTLVGQPNGLVLWHAFGVIHIPRVEDFPVMPCEVTGFTLKPDNFLAGNPAIDIAPEKNCASRLASGCLEQ